LTGIPFFKRSKNRMIGWFERLLGKTNCHRWVQR
jgi:hypothetical protein